MSFDSERRSKFSKADQKRIFEETDHMSPAYRPARPFGNRHDAEIIARQSGRPIEDFLSPAGFALLSAMESGAAEEKDTKEG